MATNDIRHAKTINAVIIKPGRPDDPDPAAVQQCKVKDPATHGNNVNIDDLPFTVCEHPPLLTSFAGRPPTRGMTGIVRVNNAGMPGHRTLASVFPTLQKSSNSMPGNLPLMPTNDDIMKAINHMENYFPLPDIKETQKRGAVVREVVEKSKQYSTSLLNGLPSNSSLFAMLEQNLPIKQNIETAKEHFNNILGASGFADLASSVMSLGSMFSGMSSSQKKQIKKKVPKEVYDAMESLSFLLPSISADSNAFYATNNRVNKEVYLANATELLSQCTNVSDLNECLMRLHHDTTLFGLEELPDIEIPVTTPFGSYSHRVSPDTTIHYGGRYKQQGTIANIGNVTIIGTDTKFKSIKANSGIEFDGNNKTYWVSSVANNNYLTVTEELPEIEEGTVFYVLKEDHQAVKQELSSFGSFMSSGATGGGGAPSINPGENLFGDSAQTMLDMFQRACPEAYQEAVNLMNAVNKEATAVKRDNIMRVMSEGGNPLEIFMQNLGG